MVLLFPNPGSAGTITLKLFLKNFICGIHISDEPKKPCTKTKGVPFSVSTANISCIFIIY